MLRCKGNVFAFVCKVVIVTIRDVNLQIKNIYLEPSAMYTPERDYGDDLVRVL